MNERISVNRKFRVDHCGRRGMRRDDAFLEPGTGRVARLLMLTVLQRTLRPWQAASLSASLHAAVRAA
jgi:hypothetical protein